MKEAHTPNMRYTPLPPWHSDNLQVENKICIFNERR